MDYLPNLADQTRLFLLSLGFGFALGVLYDLFRVARLLTGRSGFVALLTTDILYSVCCTGLSFFFFLAVGDGDVRLYLLGGEILGWLIYYFSFGTVALRLSEWLVRTIHRITRILIHIFTAPFLRFLHFMEKISIPLRKCGVSLKKVKKNLHFGLHSTHDMVYNGNVKNVTKMKGTIGLAKQHRQAHRGAKKN